MLLPGKTLALSSLLFLVPFAQKTCSCTDDVRQELADRHRAKDVVQILQYVHNFDGGTVYLLR